MGCGSFCQSVLLPNTQYKHSRSLLLDYCISKWISRATGVDASSGWVRPD